MSEAHVKSAELDDTVFNRIKMQQPTQRCTEEP